MQQFRRFARQLIGCLCRKWRFLAIPTQFRPNSYVKADYFTSVKKRHLHAAAEARRKAFPGANPRRGQEKKKALGVRLGRSQRDRFVSCEGVGRGRRGSSAGR